MSLTKLANVQEPTQAEELENALGFYGGGAAGLGALTAGTTLKGANNARQVALVEARGALPEELHKTVGNQAKKQYLRHAMDNKGKTVLKSVMNNPKAALGMGLGGGLAGTYGVSKGRDLAQQAPETAPPPEEAAAEKTAGLAKLAQATPEEIEQAMAEEEATLNNLIQHQQPERDFAGATGLAGASIGGGAGAALGGLASKKMVPSAPVSRGSLLGGGIVGGLLGGSAGLELGSRYFDSRKSPEYAAEEQRLHDEMIQAEERSNQLQFGEPQPYSDLDKRAAPEVTWKGEGSNEQPVQMMRSNPTAAFAIAQGLNPDQEEAQRINEQIGGFNDQYNNYLNAAAEREMKKDEYAGTGGIAGGVGGAGLAGGAGGKWKGKPGAVVGGLAGLVGGALGGSSVGRGLTDRMNPEYQEQMDEYRQGAQSKYDELDTVLRDVYQSR